MLLSISGLSKNYGQHQALKDINLDVEPGEIVALIGKNGAGKSTFMKSIAGDITPNAGTILYKGIDLLKDNRLLSEFGILINASFFDYLNAYDNLVLLMKASGYKDIQAIRKKVNEIIDLVGLKEKKKKYVKSFSFGMKQRLGLAQALLHEPKFLMLDEPFVGLDPIGKNILKEVIMKKARKENAGIIFSSHDLYDINEICDRVVMFDKGTKVHDEEFLFKVVYVIECDQDIEHSFGSELIDKFRQKINILENKIEFLDKEIINTLLIELLEKKVHVTDFHTRENILYDYFENEGSENE